jgi:glycosyltransferase involved in cell wall biosynthesis
MRLTVVIPCLNAEPVLGEQLEALARQDWGEAWEVVVSDNGSTDRSRDVAESYRDRVPGLRIVDSSGTRGAAHARNVAVRHARADWILSCDADDVVADDWVETMAQALHEHDFVACRLEVNRLNEPWQVESWSNAQASGLIRFSPPFLPSAGGGTLGFKRHVFEAVGGFDVTMKSREDNDFCWRVQLAGIPLHFVEDAVVHYRFPDNHAGMFRQSRVLAETQVLLYKRYRSLGMPRLGRQEAMRGRVTWIRLLKQLRQFRRYDRARRARYVRDVGYKLGRLNGSIRHRVLAL